MDYIDFIDAPAVRDHLRTLPPLPPAQRSILIAQSGIRSLPDKLAALREIRAATPPEDFARGCWSFQCDDPFPVILDRYLRTREERLAAFRKAEPGVVYVVETGYSRDYGTPFSTLGAALASVEPLEEDEAPPSIRRRRIDDADGATLVAELSRQLEIAEIDVRGGPDAGNMRIWGGDLPNGYAHVPHPFRRGDIVRQGDSYYVFDESVEETGGRYSRGVDKSDMELYGVSWHRRTGSFGHEHVFFTRFGTQRVAPADLPKEEKMLAAVATVMRDGHSLIEFLQCFTNGYRNDLETWLPPPADAPAARAGRPAILRADLPGLPANLFLGGESLFRGFPKAVRVQRSGDAGPNYRDTVELTLEPEPRFGGGTGDISPDDVRAVRDLVARNLDAFLAHWDGKMTREELLDTLKANL